MKTKLILFITGIVLLIITFFISLKSGSVNIKFIEIIKILFSKVDFSDNYIIIKEIRLPRIIYAILIGGMLGVSGAILQAILKNPLADPFITGISSGAAFFASLAIIIGVSNISLFAIIGAIFTIFIVYRLSLISNKLNIFNLLLIGVMVGTFFSSLTMLFSSIFNKDLTKVFFFLMGNLANIEIRSLKYIIIFIIIIIIISLFFAEDLNILTTSEEEALTMGVNVEFIKTIYFFLSSILVAISVSLGGVIGFVGLIIPNLLRIIAGSDMRHIIINSFLYGGVFLLISDTISRTLFLPMEIPVGIITGLFGVPVFLFIMIKTGEKYA